MFHKRRQVLPECSIFLKCESIFSCNTVLYRVIKNWPETYKAFSRRFGKSTRIFHGMPSSNLLSLFAIHKFFLVNARGFQRDILIFLAVELEDHCRDTLKIRSMLWQSEILINYDRNVFKNLSISYALDFYAR